jgi:hypothetical protein
MTYSFIDVLYLKCGLPIYPTYCWHFILFKTLSHRCREIVHRSKNVILAFHDCSTTSFIALPKVKAKQRKKDSMRRLHHFLAHKGKKNGSLLFLCLDTEKLGNVLLLVHHNSVSNAVTLLYHSI